MKVGWVNAWRQIEWLALVALASSLGLAACGVKAQASLTTRFNALGGGQHVLLLTMPVEAYSGDIFSRLPNLALLTGVDIQDVREGGQQGVRVSQDFVSLSRLNGAPETAHFINRVFPGAILRYRVSWQPHWFMRDLRVQVYVDGADRADLAEAMTYAAAGVLDASIVLELPGAVISHNGSLIDEQTIVWAWHPDRPQTLEATARVMSWPLVVSITFTLASSLLAISLSLPVSPTRSSGRTPTRPAATTSRPTRRR